MISAWRDSSELIHPNVTERAGFVQLELLYGSNQPGKQLPIVWHQSWTECARRPFRIGESSDKILCFWMENPICVALQIGVLPREFLIQLGKPVMCFYNEMDVIVERPIVSALGDVC